MNRSPGQTPDQAYWAFVEFHHTNPQVYEGIRKRALVWLARGHKHGSVEFLCNIVRWDVGTKTDHPTDIYKINNNHKAFYARLLEKRNPELRGFFQSRKSLADAPEVATRDPDADGVLL